jgi:hypothetical protein
MLSDTRERGGRGMARWGRRVIHRVSISVRGGMRIAFAAGLVACFGFQGLWAASNSGPAKAIVERSPAEIQHRFAIHPDGPTVAVNQVQQFEVTDAQGKPVAVHWNVSGLGCSGMNCGTVDDRGVYRTPATLPQPRVVILEGVLDSDPNYSVLTRIALAPAVGASAASAQPYSGAASPMPALTGGRQKRSVSTSLPAQSATAPQPTIEGQSVAVRGLAPLPRAIAAAPVVERQIARASAPPPLAHPIAPPPTIEGQNNAVRDLPLPRAIAAAPVVETLMARAAAPPPMTNPAAPAPMIERQIERNSMAAHDLPLPRAIAAAPMVDLQVAHSSKALPGANPTGPPPTVERQHVAAKNFPPLPNAVSAPPVVELQMIARGSQTLPAAKPAGPPPVLEKQHASSRDVPRLPHAIAAAPVVEIQIARASTPVPLANVTAPPVHESKPAVVQQAPPSPHAVGSAPAVETQIASRSSMPPPLPDAIAGASAARLNSGAQPPAVTPAKQNPQAVLAPMPDESTAAVPSASSQRGLTVTYRDGQLTIDARNSTLAEVLKLVAEKSGATIEIPPGSGQERIFEHAGPGPAQDVLARLLNGSVYDFIIVSSPQSPHAPAQVLLSLHTPDAPVAQPQVARLPAPTSASLWTPPAESPMAGAVVPVPTDPGVLPPREQLTPEVLGKMMREKAAQLREQMQQQQPQQ